MRKNWSKEDISIKKLSLWDENARFPDKYFKKTEDELIKFFLSKKDFKIESFAKKVVEEFDLPQQEKIIVLSHKKKFIVLEGNRRLAVYKLLSNPGLAGNPALETKFKQLAARIKITQDYKLECLVTEEKDQGLRYIDRKHLDGNNEVDWRDSERAHYRDRRGNANQGERMKVAIARTIRDLNMSEAMKDNVLGPGYVTSFWRVVTGSAAAETFGLSLDDMGDLEMVDKQFPEKLRVVITDVLAKATFNKKIISRLSQSEISQYLKDISKSDFKRADDYIKEGEQTDLFGENVLITSPTGQTKLVPKSTQRSYLIPKTCRLNIPERKINNIYRELREDLLLDGSSHSVPNAVGVTFRVFLEVSLDCYYKKRCGKTFTQQRPINEKIDEVTKFMEVNKIADKKQLRNIRIISSGNTNDILHIDRFHEYVHSGTIEPESSSLITKWDNVEDFFVILWKDLQQQTEKKKKKQKA